LAEVCRRLTDAGGRLIAGGTDVIPQMQAGRLQADRLIDLSRVTELSYIEPKNGSIHIGGLTNYMKLINSPLLQAEAPLLVQAAELVGAVQTRYRGTLGGNIANASPAGDTLPPLLALDAAVTLVSVAGERTLPLADLLQGPGKTAVALNEVIHHVSFDRLPANATSIFLKLGNRRGMAIAVVNVALLLQLDQAKRVEEVRIALGAVAPTPIRCPQAEAVLTGQPLTETLIDAAAASAAHECAPIDDVRASAGYRRQMVKVLVCRGLQSLADKRE
jgi:CO/xanthine dehydrogenase FAD-binding subunit